MQIGIRLAGVALIVLLIACANIVNLLLGRAVQRQREIAVRLALGISRSRLLRLLFAETILLAVAAVAAAIVVAYVAGSLLRRLMLPDIHWATSPLDAGVVSFALAVAVVAATIAGLIPALQSARADVNDVLKSRAGGGAGGPRGSRLRWALLASQAAFSALLLCGAGLFVRSLSNVRHLDIGFDAQRLITATVRYDDPFRAKDSTFSSRLSTLASRIATIPGVRHVALVSERPMYGISWLTFFTETDSSRRGFDPTWTGVSAGYFEASGVRLLRGEDFPSSAGGPHSVIVNEAMARVAWPGRSAIGQCMRFGKRTEPCYQVIGVAQNSREQSVIEDPAPMYYLPLNDLPGEAKGWTPGYVILSADPRSASVVGSIRAMIRQEFPGGIPLVVRLKDDLEPQYRPWRLGATLFSAFGFLALVVAVIGIYSTSSYGVQQRVHEFGVRIALGARMADVMQLVIVGGLRVVAIGVFVGIAAAIAAGRLIASLLYGVAPSDPATAIGVAVCLLVAGLAATLFPAWRAASVNPATTLKSD